MRNSHHSWMTWSLATAVAVGAALGCNNDENPDVPNRVLDRPIDVALACVEVTCEGTDGDGCQVLARPVADCQGESSACDVRDSPHLIGAVANSERNELAFFQQCSGTLSDLDPRTPGYQFVPTGALPSSVTVADNSCWIASANAGSCDLTVVETTDAAGVMFDVPGFSDAALSGAVATVSPLTFDEQGGGWSPLAARVGKVLTAPSSLSLSPDQPGQEQGDPNTCPAGRGRSVYVTFPTCDLVAEVDLNTQYILQSAQFTQDEDGVWTALSTGSSPTCAADCGAGGAAGASAGGILNPRALDLIRRPLQASNDEPLDGADFAVEGQALLVGGQGSDTLFEIKIGDDGIWEPEVNQLGLADAGGIASVHVAPAVDFALEARVCEGTEGSAVDPHQFIYVIVGDGSTRVVDRDLDVDRTEIGVECDTQLDPILSSVEEACVPVDPTSADVVPLQQRQIVGSPGILAPGGARFTDWTFFKNRGDDLVDDVGSDLPQVGTCGAVLGVGVADGGAMVFSSFDQYLGLQQAATGDADQPNVELLNPDLGPHALQTEIPPVAPENGVFGEWPVGELNLSGLPRMDNSVPLRILPQSASSVRLLAPGLRLVDYAYSPEFSSATPRSLLLGSVTNEDRLAEADDLDDTTDPPLHDQPVVRPWVRDYRGWPTGLWELQWEGDIPNTASSTGLLSCDISGWEDVTCTPSEAGQSRLTDPSAQFCDAGVLAGDKLILRGCGDDNDCGLGGVCLLESAAGGESSGICVAEQALSSDPLLREACAEFVSDPCGEAHREFLITRAFQGELWLQSLERAASSFLVGLDPEDPDEFALDACDPESPNVGDACGEDADCPGGAGFTCVLGECQCVAQVQEIIAPMLCGEVQPEGGCESHAECFELLDDSDEDPNPSVTGPGGEITERNQDFFCVDQRCRRACEDAEECLLRRLPGPRCFQELVRYSVAAHDAFVLDGPGVLDFFPDRVSADPQTSECLEAEGSTATVSTLLQSRIRIGPTLETLGVPECTSGPPTTFGASVCRITTPRSEDVNSAFHTLTYQGETIPALRISTPVGSFVLDLVDLSALSGSVPAQQGLLWPSSMARYDRGRLVRGYRVQFGTVSAYFPFNILGLTADGVNPLYFPVRIVSSPDLAKVFVVDATGSGSRFGLRGQVLKVTVNGTSTVADVLFDGVR